MDIQALAHAVELTRQGAVDSMKFAKGDLFQAFQVSNLPFLPCLAFLNSFFCFIITPHHLYAVLNGFSCGHFTLCLSCISSLNIAYWLLLLCNFFLYLDCMPNYFFYLLQNELCRMQLDVSVLDELIKEYCIYRGIVESGLWSTSRHIQTVIIILYLLFLLGFYEIMIVLNCDQRCK